MQLNIQGQHPLYKWSASIPMIMGGFPAAALMFRKGYIAQGTPVIHEERTLQGLWERPAPMIAEDPGFDPNRDRGFPGRPSGSQAGVDPLAFLVGPVEVKYGGDPAKDRVIDLSHYIDHEKKTVKSVTGQIVLDFGNGLCTIDAPKAQGAGGFLARAGLIRLGDIAIRSANDYATVLVVSMDDRPLSSSRKVLVQVGTEARPTGWKTRATEFPGEDQRPTPGFQIVRTGSAPWRVVDTSVGLAVRNPGLTKATLLDVMGFPVKEVPGTPRGPGFPSDSPPTRCTSSCPLSSNGTGSCLRITERQGRSATPRGTTRDRPSSPPSRGSDAASGHLHGACATSAPPSRNYSYTS